MPGPSTYTEAHHWLTALVEAARANYQDTGRRFAELKRELAVTRKQLELHRRLYHQALARRERGYPKSTPTPD